MAGPSASAARGEIAKAPQGTEGQIAARRPEQTRRRYDANLNDERLTHAQIDLIFRQASGKKGRLESAPLPTSLPTRWCRVRECLLDVMTQRGTKRQGDDVS